MGNILSVTTATAMGNILCHLQPKGEAQYCNGEYSFCPLEDKGDAHDLHV
jgi:hypothetical protein